MGISDDIKVKNIGLTKYDPGDTVLVDGKVYAPDEAQGNTKDAHLTVVTFSLTEFLEIVGLSGGNSYFINVISEQGKGHWITGALQITIPQAKAIVTKTWENGPKFDASITLYRKYVDPSHGAGSFSASTFTLSESDPTKELQVDYTDNLGRIYTYFADENNIPEGFEAQKSPVEKTYVNGVHIFTMSINNKYTPPLMDIEVTKFWKDAGDPQRPDTITFELYRVGEETTFKTQTATSASDWKTTFTDLPKTTLDGTAIEYEVKELPVPGYTTVVEDFIVTNTRSEKFDIPVEKIWKDEPSTQMRPATVTFNLKRGGTVVDTISFGAADGWKGEFKDVEKFDGNGDKYEYTIEEEEVAGYTGVVNGFKITNTRSGVVNIPVTKLWKDNNSMKRPEEITIHLLRNNQPYKTAEMKPEAGVWSYTFQNEPEFDSEGKPYTY